jgi:Carboxypeptidase regulatory-like domain
MRRLPLLLLSLCFVPLTPEAQTGVITGRVVTEDGGGLPGVTVYLMPVSADRRTISSGPQTRTLTDGEGNFKFTGLAPRVYSVSASSGKGYVPRPAPVSEMQDSDYHRIGANVTITLIKGGAITGRVTNAMGKPLINVQVNAAMVRGARGNPDRSNSGRSRFTDDRGTYRIYGLSPGTYVIFTRNRFDGHHSPYDIDAPTYYPSSTRETATEVTVASGGEASGVDIRYRGDRGHAVSGSISYSSGPASPNSDFKVALTNTVTGVVRSDAEFFPRAGGGMGFAIYGVTDGEYDITARWLLSSNEEVLASSPRRVVVKGADAGGIELKVLPLGIIAGKFALEATPGVCESKRKWSLEEALLAMRSGTKPGEETPARSWTIVNGLTEKGEFTVYDLAADRYFLEPRLPNENWYVKAITAPASTSSSANTKEPARGPLSADISRNGITLKAGEKITGVVATIADGAAGLSGKVIPASGGGEGSRLPARLRIHLIPAEARAADESLRFAEAFAREDGSFLLSNIPPGKYWLIALAAPDDEMSDRPVAPLAWDANERAKLRRQVMAAKNEIELQPCGRVKDYVLRFR